MLFSLKIFFLSFLFWLLSVNIIKNKYFYMEKKLNVIIAWFSYETLSHLLKLFVFPNPSKTGTDLLRCGIYDQKRPIRASTWWRESKRQSFSSQMCGAVIPLALNGHHYRQLTKNNCRKRSPPSLMAAKNQLHRQRFLSNILVFFLSRFNYVEAFIKAIQSKSRIVTTENPNRF